MNEIFATAERQEVLDDFGVKYTVDQDLNLCFDSESERKKAVKILRGALVL